MYSPKVLACNCVQEFQDSEYGPGRRFHNGMKDDRFRCTGCGNEKTGTVAPKFKKTEKAGKKK